MRYLIFCLLILAQSIGVCSAEFLHEDLLANGQPFVSWEVPLQFTRTYYVDQSHPRASDTNAGTERLPFKTIQQAARVLKAGERVVIKKGIYRESVHPLRGGTSPATMISYEAAPGHQVVVSGAVEVPLQQFSISKGWLFSRKAKRSAELNVWQVNLQPEWFGGYNPFGMTNLMSDTEWLDYKKAKMQAHFQRRGLLFANGQKFTQVARPTELDSAPDFSFWPEHNGLRLHLKLPEGKKPADYNIEATVKEQVFAPKEYGLGYIRLQGLTFRHAGNGFPVPQRGLVSASRGHYWIVEDCTVEWANSVGVDLGNEMWSTPVQGEIAHHIVRRNVISNCGISGLQCYIAKSVLLEDNLFEKIGFHDAEHAFESAGVKFHQAENCLIRRNVFRNITFAPGLWLDYKSNRNCRVTNNFFADITTARGGIYIEVSRNDCYVDRNVFYKMRSQFWLSGEYGAGGSALYTDGSDSIRFEHNVLVDIENTGYGSYLNAPRIVDMRGGITVDHRVTNNVFVDCKKHCIEFPHETNFSDHNLYLNPKPGYLKVSGQFQLDIDASQRLHQWDRHSATGKAEYHYDEKTMKLTLILPKATPSFGIAGHPATQSVYTFSDPRERTVPIVE